MRKLEIKELSVSIDDKVILNDFNLDINPGEIHTVMGPNGAGKSTLSKVIMGDNNYKIINGSIKYNDVLLNDKTVDERARMGLFLAVQSPFEIEGVTNADLLRTAVHNKEKENFKLFSFIKELDENVKKLKMDSEMIHRSINVGFSGGERKKNEILQMYMLKPSFIILDEIDSGLDVDSLKIVGKKIMEYHSEYKPAILIITHYQRLLDYIKPDFVHILKDGKIVKSGDSSLVSEIEKNGYNKFNISSTSIVEETIGNE